MSHWKGFSLANTVVLVTVEGLLSSFFFFFKSRGQSYFSKMSSYIGLTNVTIMSCFTQITPPNLWCYYCDQNRQPYKNCSLNKKEEERLCQYLAPQCLWNSCLYSRPDSFWRETLWRRFLNTLFSDGGEISGCCQTVFWNWARAKETGTSILKVLSFPSAL